ncbi:hypothetical protein X474_16320 [Dethiosulfatarculus sandiegensis]|uniref:Uncharacterized protein n=1 Tax=Dethiosulfatarculus sandiegensis TaxID=1429043 RepID=A0A0D2JU78_9BACT|nr:hypothetical protein X474_16320 [Dethiosulfatarculus sandiegensis]
MAYSGQPLFNFEALFIGTRLTAAKSKKAGR